MAVSSEISRQRTEYKMAENDIEETAAEAQEAVRAEDAQPEAPEAEPAPEQPEPAPDGEPQTAPEDPVAKLGDELAAVKEQNIRLLADFDNYRRRMARERTETYQRAAESIYTDLLPVVDNFERALSAAPAAGDAFADGMRMVYGQLKELLAKGGVEPIDALGKDFDPAVHEAIAYQPSADVAEGKVFFEHVRGYRMGDHVIRPASVIVSSGAPQSPAAGGEALATGESN